MPRPAPKASQTEKAGVVFGVNDIHFFVSGGGKIFEAAPQEVKRQLPGRSRKDIESARPRAGVASLINMAAHALRIDADARRGRNAEIGRIVESWPVVDRGCWASARVQRPATSSKSIAIGRVVMAIRTSGDATPFFLGCWITEAQCGRRTAVLTATLSIFPGKPEAISSAVPRGFEAPACSAQWTAGLRLAGQREDQQGARSRWCCRAASATAAAAREVHGAKGGDRRGNPAEHGTDFDRVTMFHRARSGAASRAAALRAARALAASRARGVWRGGDQRFTTAASRAACIVGHRHASMRRVAPARWKILVHRSTAPTVQPG